MKRALILATAAAAALSLAACQKKDNPPETTSGEANAVGQAAPVNAAQDAASAAVGATSAATMGSHDTGAFVANSAMGNMYEIQAGQIASTKGQSAGVKAFGKMMVTDHTALMNEMKPLAQAAGQTPPPGLDERRKGMIDNLNAAAPADFDKVYLAQQEAAHNETLTLMKGYADNGDDAGLKAAAAKAAPKVQMHLDKVKSLQSGGK